MRLDRRAQAPSRHFPSLFLALSFFLLTSVTPTGAAAQGAASVAAQAASAPQVLDAATAALLGRGVAALEAGPQAGFIARGTATLAGGPSGAITPSGAIEPSGAITIAAWGGSHCRVEIDFGPTASSAGGQKYVAVLNGRTATASGPGWVALPAEAGLAQGCALLPQGLPLADLAAGTAAAGTAAAGAVSDGATAASTPGVELVRMAGAHALRWSAAVELDSSSGLPTQLSYQDRKQAVEVSYSGYQTGGAGAYPAEVEETVGGVVRLKVELSSVEAHGGFSEADFPVPAPPQAARRQGGVQ